MLLLGLYLENVMPKTYGARKHPCFCFLRCCKKKQSTLNRPLQDDIGDFETKYLKAECFEPAPYEIQ
mgnify:CR=1 FL=1